MIQLCTCPIFAHNNFAALPHEYTFGPLRSFWRIASGGSCSVDSVVAAPRRSHSQRVTKVFAPRAQSRYAGCELGLILGASPGGGQIAKGCCLATQGIDLAQL